MMNIDNIKKYEHTFDRYDLTIPGYFSRKDLLIFNILSEIQNAYFLVKNALEIGVFYGRVTIHLSNLHFTSVTGIDLFDNQCENISQSGKCDSNTYEVFLNLVKEYGCSEKIKIIKQNSLNLINETFKDITFYHIDGGHSFLECISDLNLCKKNSLNQTIICVDDAFNGFWPNVTAATTIFLKENSDWKSFLISDNKMYLCKTDFYDFYCKNIKFSLKENKELKIFDGHLINYLDVPIIKI